MATLKSMRNNPRYTTSLILHGNGKLLDFDNEETGEKIRYAQYNVRAVKDCPFRSAGCEAVCYATKGNHVFPSCIESRERAYRESLSPFFADTILYTIAVEKLSKRYKDAVMLIRIHESGDFYSVQYLRKWIQVWRSVEHDDGVRFVFYTKSFPFFLMLNEQEKDIIRRRMNDGILSINLSVDDTTTSEQWRNVFEMKRQFPKCNIYRCTEDVENTEHDNVCDCADCAKCGTCNKATGKTTVVKIHSATASDMKVYRANIK